MNVHVTLCFRSDKFVSMATRTRQEYLKDLASNYATQTTIDSGSKFGELHLFIFFTVLITAFGNNKVLRKDKRSKFVNDIW